MMTMLWTRMLHMLWLALKLRTFTAAHAIIASSLHSSMRLKICSTPAFLCDSA